MLDFKEFCELDQLDENTLTKEYIKTVLDALGIKHYDIGDDLRVDINKDIKKSDKGHIQMPFKVGNIVGTVWSYIDDLSKFSGYRNDRTV